MAFCKTKPIRWRCSGSAGRGDKVVSVQQAKGCVNEVGTPSVESRTLRSSAPGAELQNEANLKVGPLSSRGRGGPREGKMQNEANLEICRFKSLKSLPGGGPFLEL